MSKTGVYDKSGKSLSNKLCIMKLIQQNYYHYFKHRTHLCMTVPNK